VRGVARGDRAAAAAPALALALRSARCGSAAGPVARYMRLRACTHPSCPFQCITNRAGRVGAPCVHRVQALGMTDAVLQDAG